jgi:hypothetical protein
MSHSVAERNVDRLVRFLDYFNDAYVNFGTAEQREEAAAAFPNRNATLPHVTMALDGTDIAVQAKKTDKPKKMYSWKLQRSGSFFHFLYAPCCSIPRRLIGTFPQP